MKKLFIIAAAACVTLASCVKNEPVQTPEFGDEISFEPPVLATTKAVGIVEGTFATTKEFHVNSYFTETAGFAVGTDYMTEPGETIGYVSEAWRATSGNKYYWPKSGYLHFLAYYPAAAANASIGQYGVKFTDYVVAAAADVDLMYSDLVEDAQKPTPNAAVQLSFNHALSAIEFKVSGATEPAYELTGITIEDVQTTGSFNQNLDDDEKDPAWGAPSAPSPVSDYVAYVAPLVESVQDGIAVTATSVFVHNESVERGSEASLILLPQNVAGKTVHVTFNMNGLPQEVDFTLTGAWLMGYRYTYSLSFTPDEITFSPTAEVWETGTGSSMN